MKRTLTDIADKIYLCDNISKISKKNINAIVNCCFYWIAQELIDGNNVTITNFGRFKPTKHKIFPSASFMPAEKLKKEIRETIAYWKEMAEIYHGGTK